MSDVIRVMLVDDHEVVRQGLRAMLEAAGMTVVAEAGTVAEAVERAALNKPDVVVMDVRLADGSGIEATREIRTKNPEINVIMLTSFADDEALFASIMAGASGYVLKQVKSNDLLRSIQTVAEGGSLLDPAVTGAVLEVIDNGKGFDPAEAEGKGQGLGNLRARAAQLGGELEIESEPGRGTWLRIRIPL